MNELVFCGAVAAGSFAGGLLGSLTGLGGGVVIIPLLTIVFRVDMRYAMGASLISVIATSSGAAAAYVREGYSNVRIGLFLEIATTIGAMLGAMLATRVPTHALAMILGAVLLYSAFAPTGRSGAASVQRASSAANGWNFGGAMPAPSGPQPYRATRVPLGFGLMAVAGGLSGLLGIGSGAIKVLAMDWAMRLPFKVSTTTSNFMIGVTAAASAGIYFHNGYIRPGLAMPVMLGALAGSLLGARLLLAQSSARLRRIFRIAIAALAVELIWEGFRKQI